MKPKKITYTATFSCGTVLTRKSHRVYTHAWRVPRPGREPTDPYAAAAGFSGSRALAVSAAGQFSHYGTPSEIVAVAVLP